MSEIIPNLVSTIIPVFNRPKMLREAVASVLAQTYRPIEIIVVDDGSTDNTPCVGDELAQANPNELRFLRKANSGVGLTREMGRLAARGEFLQYLDSDDLLLPEKFQNEVAALRAQPAADIAYGFAQLQKADGSILNRPYKWTGEVHARLFPGLLVDRWWCTNSPLYRRSLCDRIGPWHDLRWGQDWEYDARAGALGATLVHVPAFHCIWREHHGVRQTTPADQATSERIRNELRLNEVVLGSALVCDVTPGGAEMLHFSRYMFMLARDAARIGITPEARRFFNMAQKAAGSLRSRKWDLSAYRWASDLLGWQTVARLAHLRDWLRRPPSRETIPWSWVENSPPR